MKRINPETGKPFKLGDVREDGFIFQHYRLTKILKNGHLQEVWLSPTALKNAHVRANERYVRKRKYAEQNPGKKRLNPKTNKTFAFGDMVNGKYFLGYTNKYVKQDGYMPENWGKWETYHRFRCKNLRNNLILRAKRKGYKSDITTDYILEIFPKDFICPVLGIKMVWGGNKKNRNSPSVDKIYPDKGYMKGNVAVISERANSIKSDASFEEIKKVSSWLEKEIKKRKN